MPVSIAIRPLRCIVLLHIKRRDGIQLIDAVQLTDQIKTQINFVTEANKSSAQ
jgi:hypothetical protein